jgi:hypothetical protein
MIQKKDNPILYKCTECKFMVTQYFDTKLYTLRTILVNGEEKKPFVIRLGDNLNYVKNIARNINMLNPVYLETEIYKNDRPFFIKREDNTLQCDNNGNPCYFFECPIYSVKYKDGNKYCCIKHNRADERFEYFVRSGKFILAEKKGIEWELPRNIKEILAMRGYKTDIIPLSELLK